MSEIINLRQQRKAKAKTEKEKKAENNRRAFGQTKADKKKKKLEKEIADRRLEGHKRDNNDEQ